MADLIGEKISQQQSGGSPQNADEIIIARSGLNFKLTLLAIKNWIVSVFTNKSTLDKLGDNGGNLTYNGEIVGGSQQVLDNFSEYENATNYTAGDAVKYNLKLYECILDCQGILPTNETYWTEVSASESTFGSIWEEGYYNENQVVLNPYDNYLYICNMTSPYYSDDIVNEIIAGEWVVIGHIHNNKVILDNTTASFTTEQANDILTNNDKVGITTEQANDILTNNDKVGITTEQANDILTNNDKVGITTEQANDILTNNDKVGITTTQANDITANNNAIHKDKASEISTITEKTALVDDDLFIIEDSENGNVKKKVKKSNVGGGAGGEANTASNVGTSGVGVFKEKTDVDLKFKKLLAGDNITLTATENDEIEVKANGGGGDITRNYVNPVIASSILTLDFSTKNEVFVTKSGGGAIVIDEDCTIAYSNDSNFKSAWLSVEVQTASHTITFPASHKSGDYRWDTLVLTLAVGFYQISIINNGAYKSVLCSEIETE